MGYQLTEAEERLAEILWKHVPMSSAELVKICGEEIDWKKSTTYTMLKKLEQKGVFVNEKGMIVPYIPKKNGRLRKADSLSKTALAVLCQSFSQPLQRGKG